MKKQNNICLCEIILSLYDMATGPVENDLVLDNKPSKTHGRLYFSLTMLQNLHFFLIPDRIHFEFSEPMKENSYFFFLKLLVHKFFSYFSLCFFKYTYIYAYTLFYSFPIHLSNICICFYNIQYIYEYLFSFLHIFI